MSRTSRTNANLGALVFATAVAAAAALAFFGCRKSENRAVAATPSAPLPPTTPASRTIAGGRKVLYWYDPMVPGSKFDQPGKSPFMDMELVPKYADEETAGTGGPSAASVTLSPQAIRAVGVATQPVIREALSKEIRAV